MDRKFFLEEFSSKESEQNTKSSIGGREGGENRNRSKRPLRRADSSVVLIEIANGHVNSPFITVFLAERRTVDRAPFSSGPRHVIMTGRRDRICSDDRFTYGRHGHSGRP